MNELIIGLSCTFIGTIVLANHRQIAEVCSFPEDSTQPILIAVLIRNCKLLTFLWNYILLILFKITMNGLSPD